MPGAPYGAPFFCLAPHAGKRISFAHACTGQAQQGIGKMQSAVIYEGPSRIDGAPIVAIVCKMQSAGKANRKTGDMVQTYILRADVDPVAAVKTGADVSVCGDCAHRGAWDADQGRMVGRTCYVNLGQGALSVFRAYKRGAYPAITPLAASRIIAGRMVRLGTYGDPPPCLLSNGALCCTLPLGIPATPTNGAAGSRKALKAFAWPAWKRRGKLPRPALRDGAPFGSRPPPRLTSEGKRFAPLVKRRARFCSVSIAKRATGLAVAVPAFGSLRMAPTPAPQI